MEIVCCLIITNKIPDYGVSSFSTISIIFPCKKIPLSKEFHVITFSPNHQPEETMEI